MVPTIRVSEVLAALSHDPQFYAGIFAAFPGRSLTLHETFSDGDRLVCRFTLAGRHDGPFRGVPATGRDVVLPGITILHFRNGRCVERCRPPTCSACSCRSAPSPCPPEADPYRMASRS